MVGGGGSARRRAGVEQQEASKWNTGLRKNRAVIRPETKVLGHVPAPAWRHGDLWLSPFQGAVLCR